jgi:hypothetical protein
VRHGEAHGKEKQLTAPASNDTLQPLPCAGKKTHDNLLPLPCATIESARQSLPFAARRHKKRTTNIF